MKNKNYDREPLWKSSLKALALIALAVVTYLLLVSQSACTPYPVDDGRVEILSEQKADPKRDMLGILPENFHVMRWTVDADGLVWNVWAGGYPEADKYAPTAKELAGLEALYFSNAPASADPKHGKVKISPPKK